MSVSEQQRQFNKYPTPAAFKPDVWHKLQKDKKRIEASALVADFLNSGGQVTRAPEKKRKGGGNPEQIFQKDTRAPKAHERWNKKFYAGDDFVAKGPRFTSKPVPENSAAKRDIERKAGVSHTGFTGAVVATDNGKLQERKASRATTEAYIDLVSDAALRESAKRDGGRQSNNKIVEPIEDSADDVKDANRSSTIRDDYNLCNVDVAHNKRLKLAA
jgi:hypothetical protein